MDFRLILGGGETSLWDLTGVYASLSRVLNRYNKENKYFKEDYHSLVLTPKMAVNTAQTEEASPPLSASAIWLTYEALQRVNRPESESGWQYFPPLPILPGKQVPALGSGMDGR